MLQDFAKIQEVLLRGGSPRASRLPPFVNEVCGIHDSSPAASDSDEINFIRLAARNLEDLGSQ